MPDVASAPCHTTPTEWLNHPLKSAARVKLAVTPVGGSASILTVTLLLACSGPSCAEHVEVLPVVGPLICKPDSHPLVDAFGSLTCQWITTKFPRELPWYQPFVPTVPSMVYVISIELVAPSAEGMATSSAASGKRMYRPTRFLE